jgi:crossover junction endodeoxyribonuclease RuvC
MIVLGVDPGSRNTGYGVIGIENGVFSVLGFGVIRLNARLGITERIGELCVGLEQVIMHFRPDGVSLETAFFSRNARSALTLGQVRGAVIALSARLNLGVHEYAPKEIKIAVTGSGSASKEQVSSMVQKMLSIRETIRPFDVSDALAIALCDLMKCSGGESSIALLEISRKKSKRGWEHFVASHPDIFT